jgi:hypothetical protein
VWAIFASFSRCSGDIGVLRRDLADKRFVTRVISSRLSRTPYSFGQAAGLYSR